ncbi:MAG TPA: hypothetical protein VHW45_18820, partial [Candidatus Sulfotelmatobacter sp.]|nr:hypothetical protein [Candidatus Sulfotelmatobacter sp.]
MKRHALVLMVGLCAGLSMVSCGGYKSNSGNTSLPNNLTERVLASQSVTTSIVFGGLMIINGQNDTFSLASRISAGSAPGLMALSPTRNIAMTFDASSNTVFAVDTTNES